MQQRTKIENTSTGENTTANRQITRWRYNVPSSVRH